MGFSNLFKKEFPDYLEETFGNEHFLLVYLHVPKAAGNSSLGYLKNYKKKFYNVIWNEIDRSWDDFLINDQLGSFELVSGHFKFKHVQKLKQKNIPFRTVTFLRHPIERIISQYRYMCTPIHPGSENFIKQFPNFESFAFRNVSPNFVSESLVGKVYSFNEYLEKVNDNYCFIGLTEFYNLSMYTLCEGLKIPYKPHPRRNVTVKNEKNDINVSYTVYEELCQIHSLDLQFYNYLHKEYAKLSDRVLADMISKNQANQ